MYVHILSNGDVSSRSATERSKPWFCFGAYISCYQTITSRSNSGHFSPGCAIAGGLLPLARQPSMVRENGDLLLRCRLPLLVNFQPAWMNRMGAWNCNERGTRRRCHHQRCSRHGLKQHRIARVAAKPGWHSRNRLGQRLPCLSPHPERQSTRRWPRSDEIADNVCVDTIVAQARLLPLYHHPAAVSLCQLTS